MLFCEEFLCFKTTPCRHMPLLVHNTSLRKDRSAIIGEGKVLPLDMANLPEAELRAKLTDAFERYIQKMVVRVTTDVESFTRPPSEFRCDWAEGVCIYIYIYIYIHIYIHIFIYMYILHYIYI